MVPPDRSASHCLVLVGVILDSLVGATFVSMLALMQRWDWRCAFF